jgi:hypothetical protein
MSKVTIAVLFLLFVACDQATQAIGGTIVQRAGPKGADMNTALAASVKAPLEFRCVFKGRGDQAFVMYHLVANQWKAMQSCNNGAGPAAEGSLLANEPDPRRLITGWYNQGAGWKQCDIKGWHNDGKAPYLVCKMPDGWSSTFACTKGQCTKP